MGGLFGRDRGNNNNNDANFNAMIAQMNQQNQTILKLIEKLSIDAAEQIKISPENFEQEEKKIFDHLLKVVEHVIPHKLTGYENYRNIAFLGNVNVGKSSLLNTLIGQVVAEVDEGEVTTIITPYKVGNTNSAFWDFPGRTDAISYTNYQLLSFMKGMTKIVVCEKTSVTNCIRIIQLITTMKIPCAYVATFDDKYDGKARERQSAKDLEALKGMATYFRINALDVETCRALNAWILQ